MYILSWYIESYVLSLFYTGDDLKYSRHRIDELDEKKYKCKYTVIEGDLLKENLMTSIVYAFEFVEDGHGGCICKMLSEYYTKGDVKFSDEDIEFGKEKASDQFYKVVENYLLENPDAYA